ncbi:MAG: CRISPR-associated primase-polymerase type A1 [Desulfosoma sp.]
MDMGKPFVKEASESKVDYALVLRNLEKGIAENKDQESILRIIRRPEFWRALPPQDALRCARLAQAAGDIVTALAILEWLTTHCPDFMEAWRERVALLEVLGRNATQAFASQMDPPSSEDASSRNVLSDAPPWMEEAEEKGEATNEDFSQIEGPFWELRQREAAVQRYMSLFQGREDCFARQWVDRNQGTQGYVPVRRALEMADVMDHLQGRKTYGIYLLQQDSRVRLGVLDADLRLELRNREGMAQKRDLVRREQRYLLTRLMETAKSWHLPCLVEFSGGKGFHFWFFLEEPLPAALVRAVLQRLAARLQPDVSCFQLEVFPKQDRLEGKGLGNLVKLPLGIHRLTGRPSYFLNTRDRSLDGQLAVLEKVRRIPAKVFQELKSETEGAAVLVHPKREKWAADYPELAVLEDRCAALGQILVECRQQRSLSVRAEKILLGTLGFLPRAKVLLHHVFQYVPEYNPHYVDYQLSRLRGTPLGCKKIHRLLGMEVSFCDFGPNVRYAHPLLHWPEWQEPEGAMKAERVENLRDALNALKEAVRLVERFLD